jgi:hypothetical protein
MQKVRRHNTLGAAPTACKRMVSGTISLPLRGTFHLSLTVLVHYRSPLVFSLAGWSPRIRSGFHVSGSTQVPTGESHEFRLRASNPLRMDFPDHSATRAICNSPADLRDGQVGPTTPAAQRPQAFTQQVWAISPFARHYSGNREFLSFPPGTQMYHFPGFPPPALCVQTGVTRHYPCRVSPFGHPCFKARLRLHTAYRSLPRPSSASGAKASTIRPYYLDGIGSRYAVFKDQTPRSRGRIKKRVAVHTTLAPEPKALKTE